MQTHVGTVYPDIGGHDVTAGVEVHVALVYYRVQSGGHDVLGHSVREGALADQTGSRRDGHCVPDDVCRSTSKEMSGDLHKSPGHVAVSACKVTQIKENKVQVVVTCLHVVKSRVVPLHNEHARRCGELATVHNERELIK